MVKIEIEVDQIITSAVTLDVEPGDRLMVMNGVVIGLVEGRLPTPRQAVPASKAEPAPQLPTKKKRRSPGKGRNVPASDRETENRIVEQLRVKSLTANELSRRLAANNGGERLVLRNLMIGMRQRRVIEPVNPEARFPAYRLIADTAAS